VASTGAGRGNIGSEVSVSKNSAWQRGLDDTNKGKLHVYSFHLFV